MEELEEQLSTYRGHLHGLADQEQYVGEHDTVRKQLEDLIRMTEEDLLQLRGVERAPSDVKSKYRVGDQVLALFRIDNKYYEATVDAVLASGSMYLVTFHGSSNKTVVSIDKIRKTEPVYQEQLLAPSEVVEGAKVRARYSGDGKFYPAEIRSIEASGMVKVSFLGYKEIELLSVDELRKKKSQKAEAVDQSKIKAIPDGLKILPTDDPKERLRKKKASKAIKRKNHEILRAREDEEKVSGWRSFQQNKRRATNSFTDLMGREQSVFSTDDRDPRFDVERDDAYWMSHYGML